MHFYETYTQGENFMSERQENLDFYSLNKKLKPGLDPMKICSTLLDNFIGGIGVFELRGDKVAALYLNNQYYDTIGYTKEQYTQYTEDITSTLHEEGQRLILEKAAETMRDGTPFYVECLGRKYNGEDMWVLVKARVINMIESEYPVFLALIQDITPRKRKSLEDAILLERYRMMEQTTNAIVFEYDLLSDVMKFSYLSTSSSTQSREIKDYRETSKRTAIVHPEDTEMFYSALFKACKTPTKGATLDYRTTVIDQNTYRWARTTYSSIPDETGRIVKVLGRIQDIDEEEREKQRMIKLVETDSTTGLLNKLAATNHIQKLIEEGTSDDSFFAIFDIDDFKSFNDTYGHAFGDEVLKSVGDKLTEIFTDWVIARFGGDEFILFKRGITATEVTELFGRFMRSIENTVIRGESYAIHCSVGIAWSQKNDKTYAEYFDCADSLLYKAKKNGKNCIDMEQIS